MFHLDLTNILKSQKIDTTWYLEDIIQCEFKSFKVVLFVVKWYRLRLNQCDPNRTIIEHDNGFTMVNTMLFEPGTMPYVLPSQCETRSKGKASKV